MKKFRVYGIIRGSKYLGTFDAEDENDAIKKACANGASYISLCHHCTDECEDPEVVDFALEEVK